MGSRLDMIWLWILGMRRVFEIQKIFRHQGYSFFSIIVKRSNVELMIYIGNGVSELIVMSHAWSTCGDGLQCNARLSSFGPVPSRWNAILLCLWWRGWWYPDIDDIKSKIIQTPRPSSWLTQINPTGLSYPDEFVGNCQKLLVNMTIIFADEIYDRLVMDGATTVFIVVTVQIFHIAGFRGLLKSCLAKTPCEKEAASRRHICSNMRQRLGPVVQTSLGGWWTDAIPRWVEITTTELYLQGYQYSRTLSCQIKASEMLYILGDH